MAVIAMGEFDKNLRRFRQSIIADAQAEEIKQFLRSLQCEGGATTFPPRLKVSVTAS